VTITNISDPVGASSAYKGLYALDSLVQLRSRTRNLRFKLRLRGGELCLCGGELGFRLALDANYGIAHSLMELLLGLPVGVLLEILTCLFYLFVSLLLKLLADLANFVAGLFLEILAHLIYLRRHPRGGGDLGVIEKLVVGANPQNRERRPEDRQIYP
jgi:hypothetical protein